MCMTNLHCQINTIFEQGQMHQYLIVVLFKICMVILELTKIDQTKEEYSFLKFDAIRQIESEVLHITFLVFYIVVSGISNVTVS